MGVAKSAKSDPVLARLLGLHPKKIDLTLERLERLLERLGNPERALPPVIHVAGTNGKGSTTAYTRAILEAAGYRVHVYSSPHLVNFRERIRVAGQLIDDDELAALLEECEKANGDDPITFFEITTAAAFLAFSRHPADACILEVGLGGRLDATNMIASPLSTAITPVSMDHEAFLGTSLSEITAEKAGIIKEGVPVVVAGQRPEAMRTIRSVLKSVEARLIYEGADWVVRVHSDKPDRVLYEDVNGQMDLPLPYLAGEHQIKNAGHAVAILRHQSTFNIPLGAYRAGVEWARWPARLQQIESGPLLDILPEGAELWLDGGHNPAGAAVIRAFFTERLKNDPHPFHLVAGMMQGKDTRGFLKPFVSFTEGFQAVPIPGEDGAMAVADLAAYASNVGLTGRMAKDAKAALKTIAKEHKGDVPPVVLIGGSLYLAGDILKQSDLIPE